MYMDRRFRATHCFVMCRSQACTSIKAYPSYNKHVPGALASRAKQFLPASASEPITLGELDSIRIAWTKRRGSALDFYPLFAFYEGIGRTIRITLLGTLANCNRPKPEISLKLDMALTSECVERLLIIFSTDF